MTADEIREDQWMCYHQNALEAVEREDYRRPVDRPEPCDHVCPHCLGCHECCTCSEPPF